MSIDQKRKWIQFTTIVGIVLTIVMAYLIGTSTYFKAGGGFQQLLTYLGIWSPIVFIVIQISQTVYPIIPMGLHNVIGVLVFGQGWGFVFNCIGMIIGSGINFYLGRKYGESFVRAFISDKQFDKYIGKVREGRGYIRLLKIGFVAPIFPDDIFCMISGLSQLTFKEFMTIVIVYRPASLFFFTFVSSNVIQYIYQLIF